MFPVLFPNNQIIKFKLFLLLRRMAAEQEVILYNLVSEGAVMSESRSTRKKEVRCSRSLKKKVEIIGHARKTVNHNNEWGQTTKRERIN